MANCILFLALIIYGVSTNALTNSMSSSSSVDLHLYIYSSQSSILLPEIKSILQRSLSLYGYTLHFERNFNEDPLQICSLSFSRTSGLVALLVQSSELGIIPCSDTSRIIVYYQPSQATQLKEQLLSYLQQSSLERKLQSSNCHEGMVQDNSSGECLCEDSSYSLQTLCECPVGPDAFNYIANCDFQGINSADCFVKESLCDTGTQTFSCSSGYSLKGVDCTICLRDIQNCDHCPVILGTNLVNNPDFEEEAVSSIPGWLSTSSYPTISSNCVSGHQCLEGPGSLHQTINHIDSTSEYALSLWTFMSANTETASVSIGTYSVDVSDPQNLNDWNQLRITGITGLSSSETLTISLSDSEVLLDNIELRQIEDLVCYACEENYDLEGNECVCDETQGKQREGDLCSICERWITSQDITAYFSHTYTSFFLDFSVSVEDEGIDCDALFETSVLDELGVGFSCEFKNNKQLEVLLGEDFSVRNQNISIKQGALKGLSPECGYYKSAIGVDIQYIFPFPKPTANILAPSVVNFGCEDLLIDGTKSQGRLRHNLLYKWTILSDPENPSLSSFSSQIYDSKGTLEISRLFLSDGEITVTVSVMNFLEETSDKSHRMTASERDSVSIFLDKTISYEFKATSTAVYSIGAITSCEHNVDYTISWSLISDHAGIDLEALWAAQTSQWTLVIPSRTFQPFTEAEFQISVEGFSNTEKIQVSVVPEDPVIVANKASGPFSVTQDLKIDATDSYDPNQNKSLTFEWACLTGDSDCSDLIEDSTSGILLVKANQLSSGQVYEFTLECSLDSVSSSRVFEMEGVTYGVPEANIHLYNSDLLPNTLSASERNRVQLTIQGEFSYSWYMKNQIYSFQGSTSHSSIYLEEHTLEAGQEYQLVVIASNSSSSYEFTYNFYVNLAPVSGYFTSTTQEIEYSSPFKMSADDWTDPEALDPLFYSFGFSARGIDFYMSLKNQSSIFYALLPSSATAVWVQIHDQYDFTTQTLQVEVAKNPGFDIESFILEKEKQILSENTKYTDLPYILNDLNAQEISDETISQTVFDLVNDGVRTLIDQIPEYTQNEAMAVLNIIQNSLRTPDLITDKNIQRVSENILLLLSRSFKDIGIPIRVFKQYLSTLSASIYPDFNYIYNSKNITDTIYSTLSEVLKLSSNDILDHETLQINTPNIDVQEFKSDTESVSNSLFALPSGFEIAIPPLIDVPNTHYFITAAAIKPLDSGNVSVPYIIDFIIYDRASLRVADINLQSNITLESPVLNIDASLTLENADCVFLNTETLKWDGAGCYLIGIGTSKITCACDHLTIFCAGEFIEERESLMTDTNIGDPYDKEVLASADEFSLMGLYVCCFLVLIYSVGFCYARKLDKNDNQIRNSEIEKGKEKEKGDLTALRISSSVIEKQSLGQIIKQRHHLISPFLTYNPELRRVYRITIIFMSCMGKLFFLSLFYQLDENDKKTMTLIDAIDNYEHRDAWKAIYSVLMMLPITELVGILLTRSGFGRCNRIKNLIGMGLTWVILLFSCWNITGFVIGFSQEETYSWLFSAFFALLLGLVLVETLKIILVYYLLYGAYMYFKNKRKFKARKKERLPRVLRKIALIQFVSAFWDLQSFNRVVTRGNYDEDLEISRL